jgi:peptide/nickel transport system substrate-binding protein
VHSHDIGLAGGGWGADGPDGYGFLDELLNGNAIASTGNTNISEINDPVINKLFTQSNTATGAARTAIWSQIDQQAMKDAVILPSVYQKVLLYRNPAVTNAYVQAYYGMYNYAVMGVNS